MVSGVDSGVELQGALEAFVGDVVAPMRRVEMRRNAELYVRGMLAQGGRKSLEPTLKRMGASASDYESLQHFLADSRWDPALVMQRVAERVCPQVEVLAWVFDDTGFVKQGKCSPGVKRQYSGTLGKTGNCQIGVSVHAVARRASVPLGWSLYLPEEWCADDAEGEERRRRAKIPADVSFATKPELALSLVKQAASWAIDPKPLLGDVAYGNTTSLRTELNQAGLQYVLSIDPTINVFAPDTAFAPKPRSRASGRPPSRLHPDRPAMSVAEYAGLLDVDEFREVAFRTTYDGEVLTGRFACVRVIAAHAVVYDRLAPREEWLIVEWPSEAESPTDYWISNLPADAEPEQLAHLSRLRWMIELDYRQLKGHLGLDHYEGRSWLGWHHHAALVTVAHGWLTEQRLLPKVQRPA